MTSLEHSDVYVLISVTHISPLVRTSVNWTI